jgi:GT2 family glycosyltransferase
MNIQIYFNNKFIELSSNDIQNSQNQAIKKSYLINNNKLNFNKIIDEFLFDPSNDSIKIVSSDLNTLLELFKSKFYYIEAAGGFIDKHYFPFCRGRIFDSLEEDDCQYDSEEKVSWTSGAAMLIKASIFFEVGGLDDDFFAHMEEIDLCLRIQKKGYELRCNPKSSVYHLGGGTLPYNSPEKVYLNFRNNLFLIIKNHPGFLFPKLLTRMVIDSLAALKFLSEGKVKLIWCILRAHLSVYKNLPLLLNKRKILKANQFPILQYKGSIIWAFFVQKNKRYSSLNKRLF